MTSVLSFSVHDCQKICIWTPLFGHRDIDSPSRTDDRGSCFLYTMVPKRAKPERPQLFSPQSGSPLTLWYLCETASSRPLILHSFPVVMRWTAAIVIESVSRSLRSTVCNGAQARPKQLQMRRTFRLRQGCCSWTLDAFLMS